MTDRKLIKFLKIIILNVDIKNIIDDNYDEEFKSSKKALINYVENYRYFIELFNEQDADSVGEFIKELGVKFKQINKDSKDTKLFNYIVKNNLYEINEYMINLIMEKYDKNYNASFTCIMNSNISSLIKYIENNIGLYLTNVYFEDYEGAKEDEDSILRLLRFDVKYSHKESIIEEVNFIPTNINKYDNELWALLLNKNELKFLWKNVFNYYDKFDLDDNLIKYLNKTLVNNEIGKVHIKGKQDIYYKFIEKVLCNCEIKDIILDKLLDENLDYTEFNIVEADKNKVNILIDKKIIVFNVENFKLINENYHVCLIRFIEVNIDEFIKGINEHEIDNEIINDIILSKNINDINKLKIIEFANDNVEYRCNNENCAEAILDLFIKNKPNFMLNSTLRQFLLEQDISVEKKIEFLVSQFEFYDKEETKQILNSLGGEYAKITTFTRTLIILPETEVNYKLVKKLKKRKVISTFGEHKKGIRVNTFRK